MAHFLANLTTKEIHDLRHQDSRCNLPTARKDDSNLSKIGMEELLRLIREEGFGFCSWCFGSDADFEPPWQTSPAASDSVTSPTDSGT